MLYFLMRKTEWGQWPHSTSCPLFFQPFLLTSRITKLKNFFCSTMPYVADMRFTGLITKNPVHSDWWTIWHNVEPYSLDYLAEFCPDAELSAYHRRSRKDVALFDNVREWAYSAVRAYWQPNGYEAWAEAVRAACDSSNAFGLEQGGPLHVSEIKATTKSIARWVWRHFTPSEFRAIQAARGAKGGRIVNQHRKMTRVQRPKLTRVSWLISSSV